MTAAPLPLLSALASLLSLGGVASASASPAFDRACIDHYRQVDEAGVGTPESYCECLADWYARQGLGVDALDFFARVYTEDVASFVGDYPQADAWMKEASTAKLMCRKSG
jgi:hypothetical protein